MKFYPLNLSPITKSIIWGGDYLEKTYSFTKSGDNIAEAWMATLRDGESNLIKNGEFQGKTFEEYVQAVGAKNVYGEHKDFPLLIKFIDANDKLSVQVHPDDEYAHAHGLDYGKTEMWYIVDCIEGAEIVYGLNLTSPPTKEQIIEANDNGTLSNMLTRVPVKKGDSFFVPAGLVHAIGKGIVIAEIQQNSNSTFRLYDYDRIGKDGKKRELHIEEASKVIKTAFSELKSSKKAKDNDAKNPTVLCKCPYFTVEKYTLSNKQSASFKKGEMKSILCTFGLGEINMQGKNYKVKGGDSYIIPLACDEFTVTATSDNFEIIVSSVSNK